MGYFGSHPVRRTDQRIPFTRCGDEKSRDTKVAELDLALLVDKNIGRLDIWEKL